MNDLLNALDNAEEFASFLKQKGEESENLKIIYDSDGEKVPVENERGRSRSRVRERPKSRSRSRGLPIRDYNIDSDVDLSDFETHSDASDIYSENNTQWSGRRSRSSNVVER